MKIYYNYEGSPKGGGYTKFHIFTGEQDGDRNYVKNIKTKLYFFQQNDSRFTADGNDVFVSGLSQEWELAQKKMVQWLFTGTLKITSETKVSVK